MRMNLQTATEADLRYLNAPDYLTKYPVQPPEMPYGLKGGIIKRR